MAIRVIPNFQPGQVDSFDPSQTVGQFAKGAGDVVELGRRMVSRAAEQIALEKMKYLAPLAKEQAKEELKRRMMLDMEVQSTPNQALRAGVTERGLQDIGVTRDSGINESISGGLEQPPDNNSKYQESPLNDSIVNPTESASPSETAAPSSENTDILGLGDVPETIISNQIPTPSPAPTPTPAPSPISKAVAAAALSPRKARIPLGSGEFSFDPNYKEDDRKRLAAEKNAERMAEIEARKSERPLKDQYQLFEDERGKKHYVKIGAEIPDGWTPVEKNAKEKYVPITDGNRVLMQKEGDPMPDGWNVLVPSMKNAEKRDIQASIKENDSEIKNLDKLISNPELSPEQIQEFQTQKDAAMARNAALRGEKPPAPKKREVTPPSDTTKTSHWYNPATWFKGSVTPSAPAEVRIRVRDKNGNVGTVPKSQLQEALDSEEYTLAE